MLAVHGDVCWLVAGAAAWLAFPAWSLNHGWPRVRDYGLKDPLSRREILSTLPSRAVQVAVSCWAWRTTPAPPVTLAWAVATTQLVFFPYYFYALRRLGRSYVELERPGAQGAQPGAWLDLACSAYRVFEPLCGCFCTLALSARFRPFGALAL